MTQQIIQRLVLLIGLSLVLAGCANDNPLPSPASAQSQPAQSASTAAAGAPTQEPQTETQLDEGGALFLTNCAPCHQANGEGNLNQFPALNGSALVTAENPQALIQTVLHGRGVMQGFQGALSAQELAAVLTYIRNAWNNQASPVSADEIAATMRTARVQ